MRLAAKISLILCAISVAVHLVIVMLRTENPSFMDLPVYVYFAGPYVIVCVLSWSCRGRRWMSRVLLAFAVVVSLSGIASVAQYQGIETIAPFVVAFVQWIVLCGLAMLFTLIADRHRRQTVSNRDIAVRFLDAFCRGDIDRIESLLSGTCRVEGPLGTWGNRDLYVAALRKAPPDTCPHRILSVTETEDEVSVFYELERTPETITVAQLFRLRNKLIVGMLLVSRSRVAHSTSTPSPEFLIKDEREDSPEIANEVR